MRFLVIDDEKFVADSLAMILEGDGHEAVAVYDGSSALEKIKSFTPDCVISDVIMPRLDGIEVCTLTEKQHPKCQIVLFSGQASTSELIEKARGQGHKPRIVAMPVLVRVICVNFLLINLHQCW